MGRDPKRLLLLAVATSVAFLVALVAAYEIGVVRWLDAAALEGFIGLKGDRLTPIAERVAHLGDPLPFVILTAAVCALAWFTRGPRWALGVAVLLPLVAGTSQVLKPLLAHPRHTDFLGHAQITGGAFPSGHATASMALALALVVVAPKAWRPVAALAGAAFTLAVSLSLLILAWHFPSDVFGGYLVAATCALLTLAALRWADARWPERSGRAAARRMLDRNGDASPAWAVVGIALAAMAATAALVALERRAGLARYLADHTSAVVAAGGIVLAAAAVVVGISAVSTRRG